MRTRRLVLLTAATTVSAVLFLAALVGVASADVVHVVRSGETLTSIAAADGLSESALAAENGLSDTAQLGVGALIEIPPQTAANAATATDASSSTNAPSAATGGTYVVAQGDSLSGIAASIGVTVADLAADNGLDPNGTLYAGTALTLPTSSGSASTTTDDTDDVASSTTDTSSEAGPFPTDESVDGPELADAAAEYGVPAAFAEAIAWQESGWDNGVVSSTGAVGVMQIEPDTWDWLQSNVASDSLQPASASDNVRGGVLLLQDLLDQTGGSEPDAAAAYYQGLGSVQAHGMYSSTRQYVADVMALTARFGG